MRDPGVNDLKICLAAGTDDETVPIKRLALGGANVGLGFRLSPSGDQHLEIRHRLLTSNRMAAKLNTSSLTPLEAWIFYTAIYRPKLFYPTKVSAFMRSDWESVTQKFTHAVIRKMGFNGYTDRRIVFGPR